MGTHLILSKRCLEFQATSFCFSDIAHVRFYKAAEQKMKDATFVRRPRPIQVFKSSSPSIKPFQILSRPKVLYGWWRGDEDQDP